ncbi:hypothetical protein [Dyella silvae]|uniref:hypothetical protein n=1 Tax=Dyella silvae TaxID=2994424 RepID=UPI002264456D|nr:hypothetical protein [Dyella silvae]
MRLFRYLVPLSAVLLGACSTFSVSNQWKDPSWNGPSADNVLVVGITKSDTYRHIFEDTFVQQLQAAGVQARQSYSQSPAGVTSEKLGDVIKSTGAQVVLTTRVQRVEQKLSVTPGVPESGGFYGWYGGAWASTPDVTQYDAVTLETTAWDMKTQKIVWAVTTEGVGTSNITRATQDLAKTIIPKLKADGIIR